MTAVVIVALVVGAVVAAFGAWVVVMNRLDRRRERRERDATRAYHRRLP